ncbi:MAG TPA: putative metal-dependent hydrolase [Candidatus Kapabacteria bacterium]|nr:putative metal-dependent hydrolase [Candidatus Kapabacteria bacterium]
MLSTEERNALIAKIEHVPAQVETAVKGLNEEQLSTPYREGGWTVRQVVHHIADTHLTMFSRAKFILTQEHPTLPAFDQDDWAALPDANGPVPASLDIIRGVHERWATLLKSSSADAWQRTAYHPERGEVTLEIMTNVYAGHGENHTQQIMMLRQQRGW